MFPVVVVALLFSIAAAMDGGRHLGTGPAVEPNAALVVDDGALSEAVNARLGLRVSEIVSLDTGPAAPGAFQVQVAIGGAPLTLSLQPQSTRAPSYQLLVQTDDGAIVSVEPGPERTFRGVVTEMPGSSVAASLTDDGLHARILLPEGEQFWIEPIATRLPGAAAGLHAVYRNSDIAPAGGSCGNVGLHRDDDVVQGALGGDPVRGAGGTAVAQLACDADHEYFLAFGGTVASVESQITAVVNSMNVQYERDVGITHQLTAIVVRTGSNDPYTAKQSRNRLNEFQQEWNANQTGIPRDTAQLFTGIDLAGLTIGEAFDFGVVCDVPRSYSIVSNFTSAFGCQTDLTAHELGHCWDARHCACSSYTMNASIVCANQFNPSITIPVITSFRDSIGCLDGGQPPCQTNAECDDGDPCTTDACVGGNCVNTPIDCDDGDPCTSDSCDGSGNCVNDPIPNCGGGVHVDCVTYATSGGRGGTKNLNIVVLVVDDLGSPVSGASVSVSVTFPSGGVGTATTDTDDAGVAGFVARNADSGCYVTDVTAIDAGSLVFDGTEPANGFDKGTDSTPDADCRSGSDPCGAG